MIRYNVHLSDEILEALKAQAKEKGVTVAELIRRALMEFVWPKKT